MKNIGNWQDDATAGKDVPDWGLEPMAEAGQENAVETPVEAEPSVADKRLEELSKERIEVPLENPEQKAAQVETMRAEIAEMAPRVTETQTVENVAVREESIASTKKIAVPMIERLVENSAIQTGGGWFNKSKLLAEATGIDRKALVALGWGNKDAQGKLHSLWSLPQVPVGKFENLRFSR